MPSLTVLAHRGPQNVTHIIYKTNVNCVFIKGCLDFLIKQGLVEKHNIGKRVVYASTQHGINVLKYFKETKQVLPIVEKARNQAAIPY